MNKKVHQDKIEKFLNSYFKETHKIYVDGNFREESFYPSLKTLFENCYQLFHNEKDAHVLVLPRKTQVGIPDFRIGKNGEIIGYIEAKTPDTKLNDVEDSEQLSRYRDSLPNLILTNFLEFRLYRHGNLINQVEVGRQFTLQNLQQPPVPEKLGLFYDLVEVFFSFSIPEITKSSALSIELAKRTRFLEHILHEELLEENREVGRFFDAFREELIDTLTKDRFADLYAQTITYGLFAASIKTLKEFKRENAWRFIPESLPLLKEIFYSMTGPHFPESLIWIVDELSQVLSKADISSILKEFKTTKWEEDPVIQFYETFLKTYDPEERERLGVYYTPLPAVSYIVRSIHGLLKDKFGKSEGLATTDVTLLDPAAGTLTFVVQAIKQVQKELEEKNKGGLVKSYIEEHIIPHFHAFEILVAPYTVGHFKVSMILEEMGYRFKTDERFQFFLTNTLEMKTPKQTSVLIDLTKEGQEAQRIKEKVPILVVLGNPPYSVSSENKSDFIENLMSDYKEDVKKERNIQPLSDDYIKFIRFAHWKIEQAEKGILGFISNNSYLSGIIHRGMRRKLLETFDEIYILNLHGSSRIGEKTPSGEKDENVFDIQQGVAIVLYAKLDKPKIKKKVYYSDLWGLREEKYKTLFEKEVQLVKWSEIQPDFPYYFFVPKDFSLQNEYDKFWKLSEIFKEFKTGVATHRDHFVVGFNKKELIQKLRIFTGILTNDIVKKSLDLKDTRDWDFEKAREKAKVSNLEGIIKPYSYRAFDMRFILYSSILLEFDRYDLMKHISKANNIALVSTKILSKLPYAHSFISECIGDNSFISNRTKEKNYFFPLYLYPAETKDGLFKEDAIKSKPSANFTIEFLRIIKDSLGYEPAPIEIFCYIYAVLCSPYYRKRYEEFLKIDFPKIPLPLNINQYKEMRKIGKELIDLHLLKHSILNKTEIGFPTSGSNSIEKVNYEKGKVLINKNQYFEGIPIKVWNYRIGAYQVMDKYLKDRKGRKLALEEINHYMKVEKAIRLTIEFQDKIDKVYKNFN